MKKLVVVKSNKEGVQWENFYNDKEVAIDAIQSCVNVLYQGEQFCSWYYGDVFIVTICNEHLDVYELFESEISYTRPLPL